MTASTKYTLGKTKAGVKTKKVAHCKLIHVSQEASKVGKNCTIMQSACFGQVSRQESALKDDSKAHVCMYVCVCVRLGSLWVCNSLALLEIPVPNLKSE